VQVVRLEPRYRFNRPFPAVTIGNFDGVHLGHQVLVSQALARARAAQGTAVALTFDPHPARVIDPERAAPALMTLDQKAEAMAALGLDVLAVVPFDAERAAQPADAFGREVLAGMLGARVVIVGGAFRFGRGRAGDAASLTRLGEALGFEVVAMPPVEHGGQPISSSRIRRLIEEGQVAEAGELLGRPFFVDGRVVRGDGRGRTLGIPTANLDVVNEAVPRRGVYAGWCRALDPEPGPRWPAVANLGRRPTFGGRDTTVEAHLLDREVDLYGRTLRLEFVARLRDERPFAGREALVEQIRDDIAGARPLLDAASKRTL
jgi:riboflavin kinase/FMN adenylyltransferase